MKKNVGWLMIAGLVAFAGQATEPIETSWGKVLFEGGAPGTVRLQVATIPSSGKLSLPTPFANVTQAYRSGDATRAPLTVSFNKNATVIEVQAPTEPGEVILETAEKTTQFADGRIVFSALDGQIHGSKAKLETHPGNHRVGFWVNAADYVIWDYTASRWGAYDVELTYSLAGGSANDVQISYAGKDLPVTIQPTGSWYVYSVVSAGRVYVPQAGKQTLKVACTRKAGGAVMNLKAVTLRPAPEGEPVVQGDDGIVVCHAKQSVIQGVNLRYEPHPKKNTNGYWSNPNDRCHWDFQLNKPGAYNLEILQGCGKGHGGSEVEISVNNQTNAFTVQDTGHFQNFVPRIVGDVTFAEAGAYRVTVRPIKKAGAAVMDLRQLRLIPKDE